MPDDAFSVRRTRIVWKGGMRPASGMQVVLEVRRTLHSRTALMACLLLGTVGGFWLHLHHATVTLHLDQLVQLLPI